MPAEVVNVRRVMMMLGRVLVTGACAAAATAFASCGTPAKSSTLSVDDLDATTSAMAEKLRASALLASRTPDSPPMIVAIHKVQNLTSDLIPEAQQWWMMARVRDRLNVNTLRRDRNVTFVIPKEFLLEGMERGTIEAGAAAKREPTHVMAATFHSATRAAGKDRTDAYLCEYRITALSDGELKWSDTFEFKKVAFGRSYD